MVEEIELARKTEPSNLKLSTDLQEIWKQSTVNSKK